MVKDGGEDRKYRKVRGDLDLLDGFDDELDHNQVRSRNSGQVPNILLNSKPIDGNSEILNASLISG